MTEPCDLLTLCKGYVCESMEFFFFCGAGGFCGEGDVSGFWLAAWLPLSCFESVLECSLFKGDFFGVGLGVLLFFIPFVFFKSIDYKIAGSICLSSWF